MLNKFPDCAKILDKYRINPGNVGFKEKKDIQFSSMIEVAAKNNKPVRIGVNWGSLDQDLLSDLMDENSKLKKPLDAESVTKKALIVSALESAKRAEELGLKKEQIIISCKVSEIHTLVEVYDELAKKCKYSLHLGLTEAGMGIKGIVSSTAALSLILSKGIGDTIRISLTPKPEGDRKEEVYVAQEILQNLGIRSFTPKVTACPGCGSARPGRDLGIPQGVPNVRDAPDRQSHVRGLRPLRAFHRRRAPGRDARGRPRATGLRGQAFR